MVKRKIILLSIGVFLLLLSSLYVYLGGFIAIELRQTECSDLNLVTRSVECQSAIVAKLEMNRFVMPGPDKTKRAIQDFAKEKGLTLKGIYIDKIISSDHVEVWAPVGS